MPTHTVVLADHQASLVERLVASGRYQNASDTAALQASVIGGIRSCIVGISPEYPFPDAAAHGLPAKKQRTFDVCFRSTDLWPDGADEAEVHVGVFHAYLEKS